MPGVTATIPGLRTLLVECDPLQVSPGEVAARIAGLIDAPPPPPTPAAAPATWVLPVCYEPPFAPDLAEVAVLTRLRPHEVVALHSAATYRVAMLGNLPGLPYLLGLPERLAVPRRADPREAVPEGSVGITGALSCVYPRTGPGGWLLVGRTPRRILDPHADPPTLLRPGDEVRFRPIGASELADLEAVEQGRAHGGAAPAAAAGALRVRRAGLLTTVQDGGRRGAQHLGVPVSGAMDAEALRLANALVGNDAGEAALEITHLGPLLEVEASSVLVAVAGGSVDLRAHRAGGGDEVLERCRSTVLHRGDRLDVGRVVDGLRCIVAVAGGIAVPPVMGSRSTYPRGGFGGLDGRPLAAGDRLPLRLGEAPSGRERRLEPPAAPDGPLRVVPGPQTGHLTGAALETLLTSAYRVSHRSDRSGLRLEGPALRHAAGADIDSEGCAAGSIQVPGNGLPIVLAADRGTTGGYPKIATVASVDLPRLGRLRPGDEVRFTAVDVDTAVRLRRERERSLRALLGEVGRPAG